MRRTLGETQQFYGITAINPSGVLACAASKKPGASHLMTASGERVLFVAQPQAAPTAHASIYARPDDPSDAGMSWRQVLQKKGTHPRADTYSSLKGRLNSVIQAAQPLTGEPQAALVEKGYEYLRSICEVIVESELLQGVTQRYQPNVMMTRLANIKTDRLQPAVTTIMPIFEDCCRYMSGHSQPLETLNVRPTRDDLKAAWATVQTALAAYKAQ